MHIMLGFAKILPSRYQTKIIFKEFDFFNRLKYSEDIFLGRAPKGSNNLLFRLCIFTYIEPFKSVYRCVCVCVCVCVHVSGGVCVCRFN